MHGRFVSYLRVSTDRQGKSGLGLEAQRAAVAGFLNGGAWTLLGEYVEVESGRKAQRPQLDAALAHCRQTGATLVIAKLDRLTRDAHFLLGLQKGGVEFVAADMPHANRLTIGIMALMAEEEARMISARTKAALAAAKARGVKLGGYRSAAPPPAYKASLAARRASQEAYARDFGPQVAALREEGLSLREIAAIMEERRIRTPRGGEWSAASVRAVLLAHEALEASARS